MPVSYEIKYADGRVENDCGSDGLYYVFSDGRTLKMQTTLGWCQACNALAEIEALGGVQEEKAFDEMLDDMFGEGFTQACLKSVRPGDAIPGSDLQNAFVEARQSPPRCLSCGSPDTIEIPFGTQFESPSGTGSFQIEMVGFADAEYKDWAFDTEGKRIN